jgi:peptidoglycan/LPS O-acetylase OafA/YrhL
VRRPQQPEHPAAAAPTSGRFRSLDLLRGLACIGIIVFHSGGRPPDAGNLVQELIARFWVGLPAFYVISGYCITASIERTRANGIPLRQYFAGRLRRILPPYWSAIALVATVAGLLAYFGRADVLSHTYDGFDPIPPPLDLSRWQWLGTITLTEGWREHVLPFDNGYWYMGTAWTLGYEEQFYVMAGLLLVLAPRNWFTLAAGVSLAVVAVASLIPHDAISGFFFNGRWLVFAYGIGVYYQCHLARGRRRLIVPIAALIGYAWSVSRVGLTMGSASLQGEIGVGALTALVLPLAYPYDAALGRLAVLRPFQWCGLRCYSLYLLHWPIAKAVFWIFWTAGVRNSSVLLVTAVPITIALALGATAIFFHYVERPCMSARRVPATPPRDPSPVAAPIGSAA